MTLWSKTQTAITPGNGYPMYSHPEFDFEGPYGNPPSRLSTITRKTKAKHIKDYLNKKRRLDSLYSSAGLRGSGYDDSYSYAALRGCGRSCGRCKGGSYNSAALRGYGMYTKAAIKGYGVDTVLSTLVESVGGQVAGTLEAIAESEGKKIEEFLSDPDKVKSKLKEIGDWILRKVGGVDGILKKLKKFWEKMKSWFTGKPKKPDEEETKPIKPIFDDVKPTPKSSPSVSNPEENSQIHYNPYGDIFY